jgi:cytochrome c-type biogenesis protein CcmH
MARAPALTDRHLADEDGAEAPPSAGRYRSWAFWLASAAVAGIAAISAAGLLGGHAEPETLYQRTMAIAGQYRCPVCAGESAAASDAPAAVEIRQLVRKWLQEGESPAQIRTYLVADYGPSILEKPPASGLDSLVWILPALGVALGAGGLALAFYRWKRVGWLPAEGVATPAGARATPLRGPLTHGPLTRDPRTSSAIVSQGTLFELEGGPCQASRKGAWPRARRLSLPAGVALVAIALVLLLVDRFSSPELPGGTITGSLSGLNTELAEAQAVASKAPVSALEIYQEILAAYPDQPIALAGEGWIYAEAGFAGRALTLLAEAEKADPSYGPAHLYRGLVLLDEAGKKRSAERELEWYLGHDPSPDLAKVARQALAKAKDATA